MTLNRARTTKEALNAAGLSSIAEFQQHLCDIAKAQNDGTHSYYGTTEDCSDHDPPVYPGVETNIELTHENTDMTDMSAGVIEITGTLEVYPGVGLPTLPATPTEIAENMYVAIGWKDATSILDQYYLTSNGITFQGLTLDECTREGFMFNLMRNRDALKAKYEHADPDKVDEFGEDLSVAYVKYTDLKSASSSSPVSVPFQIQFPITDLVALQGMSQWCNFLHGNLGIKLKLNTEGIVYKLVNPAYVLKRKNALGQNVPGASDNLLDPATWNFIDRNFAEAGTEYNFPSFTVAGSGPYTFTVSAPVASALQVSKMSAWMRITKHGYNISNGAQQSLRTLYSQPQYIRSLYLTVESYGGNLDYKGNGAYNFNLTKNISAKYFRQLAVFFPLNNQSHVVFPRIALRNLQLEINNRKYPEDPFSTDEMRIYRVSRLASHLAEDEQFSKSFERSLCAETHDPTSGHIYKGSLGDQTGFCVIIPLERPNAENVFDGFASETGLVKVNLKGEFTYKTTDTNPDTLPSPYQFPIKMPEIWIPNEAYITLRPPT
jgi:hypothetical protein